MESGQRMYRKGRKLGSSRRRQMREPADGQDAPGDPGPESWTSEAEAELQTFFQNCGAKDRGFVTREDLAEAKFRFLGNEEELQMIFDWVDSERRGRLSLEEFSSGLKNIFGSSLSTQGLRRRRPPPSPRVSVTASFPALEEADSEEREAFLALLGQLGTGPSIPEEKEIWQLWGKLRQEEPQLVGNLEGFLAEMSSRLQEVRADKEALEQTLRKRDSDHHREVWQLYEEMERQIHREKRQLQAQSESRGQALSAQMQEALEAKELEVQRLQQGQSELEAQLHSLSDSHREATSENLQLREAGQDLAGQLEEVRGQLQVTRGHLDAARGRVSWQVEEEVSVPGASKKVPGTQAEASEEGPLPGLFGDSDDWNQLLSGFSSPWQRALQLSWSPPPTPHAASGPPTPRVVRQISISEPHPGPDPDGPPRSPTGPPPSTQDGKGEDVAGQAMGPEQPVGPGGLEPSIEPAAGLQAGSPWGLLGAPAKESGSLVAAALKVLVPVEDAGSRPPSQASTGLSEQLQASDDTDPGPRPAPAKQSRQRDAPQAEGAEPGLASLGALVPAEGLEPVGQAPQEVPELGEPRLAGQDSHPGELREAHGQVPGPERMPVQPLQSPEEEPQAGEGKAVGRGRQDPSSEQAAEATESTQPTPLPASTHAEPLQALLAVAPARGQLSPAGQSPPTGVQELPQTLPTPAEPKAPPRPQPDTAQAERQPGRLPPGEPQAESWPSAPGMSSSPGHPAATSQPQADLDYLFHVIFLGDSNVGKTSFLHLLHQNAFATGLAATVGVDFRVKTLLVDNKCFALQLWDTAGQERYHSVTRQLLRKADGVVLMYDVTCQESFAHVRYWLDCLQDAGAQGVVLLLLGNKMDCEEARQVPTEAGRQLAQTPALPWEDYIKSPLPELASVSL
ncbi:PREDICTED: ras-related protein Rab-44 isoform X2 [Chinchilla lanigera]|uniref:RAB44, member RAS onco family n=1 Tax=Chinchilla lanigera TaxID=34839 RepID=A0A8C2VIG4_CHILA|nr:PREDICTED: ras-related protein Rab-44 isoform X2 [Chinchilla lanigera]